MTKMFLAAGVAALAIAAPVAAKPDHNGNDRRAAAKADRGGAKTQTARSDRRGGQRVQSAKTERRGGEQRFAMAQNSEKRRGGDVRTERRSPNAEVRQTERRSAKVERADDRRMARTERRNEVRTVKVDRNDRREVRNLNRDDRRELRIANRADRDVVRVRNLDDDRFNPRFGQHGMARGLIDGCPPGLWAKGNGCMPPGQAKKLVGQVIPATYRERPVPIGLRDIYRDTDDYYWRYGDGYAYRVNRSNNLVASLLPLMGLGYTVGQPFPASYMNSYLPSYYQPFYQSSGDDYYRYANGYIYEVDGRTGLIEDVDPAYGYGYGVGQMWPSAYDYYNVPLAYRDMYYDTDDYYYRYAPGSIYQVDRSSNLITAVASLLTGGFTVGQQLPMGYSTYNVPYAYRSQYYDTPDAWYRYNNGYIYQVDPTTQLVTALVRALV